MSVAIPLPERMDAQTVTALRDDLLAAQGDVVLQADRVRMIGTLGAQVLMAARTHFAGLGAALRIDAPSADFIDCITDMGLDLDRLQTQGVSP